MCSRYYFAPVPYPAPPVGPPGPEFDGVGAEIEELLGRWGGMVTAREVDGESRPTNAGLVIVQEGKQLVQRTMRWGLVPRWAYEIKSYATYNAVGETLETTASFRESFKDRRCLVPVTCFYEWKARPGEEQKKRPKKDKFRFSARDGSVLYIAGLWDRATIGGVDLESYTMVTTVPNELLAQYHHRMVVILRPENFAEWLDPDNHDTKALRRLLVPCAAEWLKVEGVTV